MMDFTFGITTDYSDYNRLKEIVSSIQRLEIPNYQILIIGDGTFESTENLHYIPFDDRQRFGWITRKKNILVQSSDYENVVLMHDYFLFDENWYKNFLAFGNDWEICSNSQLLINGKRHYSDWVTWDDPVYPKWTPLPYDEWSRTQYQYVSGGYYIIKKYVGIEEPLNETLTWGGLEDVEWSLRVRQKYVMKCNGNSIVRHNKLHRDARL